MSTNSLRSIVTRGVFWNAIDKVSGQVLQLGLGIVLARLLLPADFGLIGMISIFIVISQVFIDSGMASGLIQSQERRDVDYSTVFVFNLFVSLLLYLILYNIAPLIAEFYGEDRLILLTRVVGLNLLIGAMVIVQRTKLNISIDFKTLAKVNVTSNLIGGLIAIAAAFCHFGYWSLVIQMIVTNLTAMVLLWIFSNWKLSFSFSFLSFKRLFGFGSKILASRLYAQSMHNSYNVLIGKYYSASSLGFYTRAVSFAQLSAGSVANILQQVTYPVLASLQNDRDRLASIYGRMVRMAAFIIFPTMALLAILAKPIVLVLLTDKWLDMVVLLQWMALARMFYPISVINMNVLNAVGRSDLFLKVDLAKAPLIILALIITLPLGLKAIVIGNTVIAFLAVFINAYVPGKLLGYGPIDQIRDLLPFIFSTITMVLVVVLFVSLTENSCGKVFLGTFSGVMSYLAISYLLKLEELDELRLMVSSLNLRSNETK